MQVTWKYRFKNIDDIHGRHRINDSAEPAGFGGVRERGIAVVEYEYGPFQRKAASVPIGKSREPVWPVGVVGSITHNAVIAAAIVAPTSAYRGIGMDIETVPSPAVLDSMSTTVVSSTELDLLRSQYGQLPP